jgi:hypothetical protein
LASGEKIWELRSSSTIIRGRVGLIEKGSGCIVAGATLVDCHGPLTAEQLDDSEHRHCFTAAELLEFSQTNAYAWYAHMPIYVS